MAVCDPATILHRPQEVSDNLVGKDILAEPRAERPLL
jgi:hypothetical protein